jgi:predicted nucleotidyltransferase
VKVISFDAERARWHVEQAVSALARRRPEIDRVILFGSLAAGGAVPGSDADLVVVLARSDRTFRDRIPLYIPEGCPVPVDVFPYTRQECADMLASGHGFLRRALAEGIPIYERAVEA